MLKHSEELERRFGSVCHRVFRRDPSHGGISVRVLEEWDSLTHIKLILELEAEFGLDIEPEAIVALYSDGDTILNYLRARGVGIA